MPTTEQESILSRHCSDARYVWNLAVEQDSWWRPGRHSAPGYLEQCRQLTAARGENSWLADGSQMVQQQALRDHRQAIANFFAGTHRRPTWRKAGRDEVAGVGVELLYVDPERAGELLQVIRLRRGDVPSGRGQGRARERG